MKTTYLETKLIELDEKIKKLEKKRNTDRSAASKISLSKLKKQKLILKDQLLTEKKEKYNEKRS